jgi:hypothetical protein
MHRSRLPAYSLEISVFIGSSSHRWTWLTEAARQDTTDVDFLLFRHANVWWYEFWFANRRVLELREVRFENSGQALVFGSA